MTDDKNSVKVEMLGTSFTLRADADKEHLERLINFYKIYVNRVRNDHKIKDPLKTAIVAGILLADSGTSKSDLNLINEEAKAASKIADDLIKKIESCLIK